MSQPLPHWIKCYPLTLLASFLLYLAPARAWEEQQALDFILAHNPLLRAYQAAVREFSPPTRNERMLEHTSIYARLGIGGTDFRDQPVIGQAGVQIAIPLASPKEQREWALKRVDEARAIDDLRTRVFQDISNLRQHEAELAAAHTRLKFYSDKSGWAQQRVKEGYDDAANLWDIGKQLTETRAEVARLEVLVPAERHKVAWHAGDAWTALLAYLEGKAALPGS